MSESSGVRRGVQTHVYPMPPTSMMCDVHASVPMIRPPTNAGVTTCMTPSTPVRHAVYPWIATVTQGYKGRFEGVCHHEIPEVPRGQPGIVRGEDVALRHGLEREVLHEMQHALRHGVHVAGSAGDLSQKHPTIITIHKSMVGLLSGLIYTACAIMRPWRSWKDKGISLSDTSHIYTVCIFTRGSKGNALSTHKDTTGEIATLAHDGRHRSA